MSKASGSLPSWSLHSGLGGNHREMHRKARCFQPLNYRYFARLTSFSQTALGPDHKCASSQVSCLPSQDGKVGRAQEEGWVFSSILAPLGQSCVPRVDPLGKLSSDTGGLDTACQATSINTWADYSCESHCESDYRITHFPSPKSVANAI